MTGTESRGVTSLRRRCQAVLRLYWLRPRLPMRLGLLAILLGFGHIASKQPTYASFMVIIVCTLAALFREELFTQGSSRLIPGFAAPHLLVPTLLSGLWFLIFAAQSMAGWAAIFGFTAILSCLSSVNLLIWLMMPLSFLKDDPLLTFNKELDPSDQLRVGAAACLLAGVLAVRKARRLTRLATMETDTGRRGAATRSRGQENQDWTKVPSDSSRLAQASGFQRRLIDAAFERALGYRNHKPGAILLGLAPYLGYFNLSLPGFFILPLTCAEAAAYLGFDLGRDWSRFAASPEVLAPVSLLNALTSIAQGSQTPQTRRTQLEWWSLTPSGRSEWIRTFLLSLWVEIGLNQLFIAAPISLFLLVSQRFSSSCLESLVSAWILGCGLFSSGLFLNLKLQAECVAFAELAGTLAYCGVYAIAAGTLYVLDAWNLWYAWIPFVVLPALLTWRFYKGAARAWMRFEVGAK